MGRWFGGVSCVMPRRARPWAARFGLCAASALVGSAWAYPTKFDPSPKTDPQIPVFEAADPAYRLRAEAYRALRADDWRRAMKVSREWASVDPDDDTPWVLLAWSHAERNDYVNVVAAYNRAIDINPRQRHPVWRSLGVAYTTLKHYDHAVSAYARAAELDPAEPQTWFDLCEAHLRNSEPAPAIRAAQRAIERVGDYAEAWACHGNALVQTGRLEDALAAFRKAIDGKTMDARTDRVAFWASLGWVYHQLNRPDGVREAVEGINRWNTDAADRFREKYMAGDERPIR